jgi:hypothetical protein
MTDIQDKKRAEKLAHEHNTLFTTAKSLGDDPRNLAENIADTAGGANIPDPSDVPGGVDGLGEDMMESLEEDVLTRRIGRELSHQNGEKKTQNDK